MQAVLILDANQRSALAATRSLGRRGIPVVAADERPETLAGSSRYCRGTFVYPPPSSDPAGFIAAVRRACSERGIGVIFPMTDLTVRLVLERRAQLADVCVPFAPLETYETLTDKTRLMTLANDLGVVTPATRAVDTLGQLEEMRGTLTFPLVLKPHRSRLLCGGQWIPATVKYASSQRELEQIASKHDCFARHPFLIQEYVEGEGQGVFALYDRGRPVVFFAHRRLREKPPSGGVSVLSESIPVDARLRDAAQRILDRVGWHGVAMVEFKIARDGTPYLIEVNARFWGSLQLAIDAGVDFPYLLYRVAVDAGHAEANGYRIGVKSRWLLGDLDHLYLTCKKGLDGALGRRSKLRAALRFANFFDRTTQGDVNRWDDWRPFVAELKQYLRAR